jgi:hypothetical protein
LSEKELMVLQNAAARLNSSQSDESARQALLDVRKQLAGMRQRAAGAAGGAVPDSGSGGQKVGDQKKFANGSVGVWDGQGWVKQ